MKKEINFENKNKKSNLWVNKTQSTGKETIKKWEKWRIKREKKVPNFRSFPRELELLLNDVEFYDRGENEK